MSVPSSLKSTSSSSMRPRRRLLAVYFFLCGCLVYLYIYIYIDVDSNRLFCSKKCCAAPTQTRKRIYPERSNASARDVRWLRFGLVWFGGCGNLEDFIIGNHTQSQDAHAQICADVKSAKGICGEHSHKFTALVSRGWFSGFFSIQTARRVIQPYGILFTRKMH